MNVNEDNKEKERETKEKNIHIPKIVRIIFGIWSDILYGWYFRWKKFSEWNEMNVRMVNISACTPSMLHELDYRCVYVLSHTFCHFVLSLPLFSIRSSSVLPDIVVCEIVGLTVAVASVATDILWLANMQKYHIEWLKKHMTLLYNSISFGVFFSSFIGPVDVWIYIHI